ncbi:MAG: MBL fold metallo-hydrolase [Lachnospiraceae bacterium]|nr:MBL fold metallo-hydrolase [Lachnospiraceae bacterium]
MSEVQIKRIDDIISYIPCVEHPLSSDIGIIRGEKHTYLFDVGSSFADLDFLYSLPESTVIIVSHFHRDHTWWLTKHHPGEGEMLPDDTISLSYRPIRAEKIYAGSHIGHYTPDATLVTERITINDGVKLDIIPLRTSHARGSLALMVNDDFIFLGDATYPCLGYDKEPDYYNVQLLKDLIEQLKSLSATRCGLSHDHRFVRPKNVVLRQLEGVYNNRDPKSPYIRFSSPIK